MKANLLVVYWMRAIFVTTAAAAPTWQPGRRHLAPKNSISGFPNFGFSNLLFRFTSADRTHTWPSSLPALFFIFIWNNRFLDSFLRSIVRDARPFFVSKGNVEFPFLFSRFFFFISFCTVECIFIRSRMIESSWVAGDRGSNLKRCYISLSLYVCLDQSGLLISCVCVCQWELMPYQIHRRTRWSLLVDQSRWTISAHHPPFISHWERRNGRPYLIAFYCGPTAPVSNRIHVSARHCFAAGLGFFLLIRLAWLTTPTRLCLSPQQIWFICLMTFFLFLSLAGVWVQFHASRYRPSRAGPTWTRSAAAEEVAAAAAAVPATAPATTTTTVRVRRRRPAPAAAVALAVAQLILQPLLPPPPSKNGANPTRSPSRRSTSVWTRNDAGSR